MPSKTNSLLLLSDIALGHLSSNGFENGTTEDFSTSSGPKKEKKSYQSHNALKFSRRLLLLSYRATHLPPQGELLKIKASCPVSRSSVQLENAMTAVQVLQQVQTVLSNLGKKR